MAKKEASSGALMQLKLQIKNKAPGRLYIFHGEEVFLLNHYLSSLRKLLLDPLTESFNFHSLNNETFDLRAMADAVEAMPMMAESTLVIVDDIDLFKLPEDDRNKLGELLSDIPEWCTVVFTYETVVWKPDKRYKKLWDAISSNGLIVEFARQEQRDLVAWIQRHFAANQKRISPELCIYLIEITGGTMTALSGEIRKISAYSGADEIRRSDIDAVTEPILEAEVFQMTDMLGSGDYRAALTKLQTLLQKQEEPIKILGAVGGHFRRIGAARVLLDHGRPASELQKLYAMSSEYPARKAMEAARRFSAQFCATASRLILETDHAMKTSFDDKDRLLEILILRLAQEARNG